MPFPSAISAPQKTTLRTSNYWQRTFIAFNPGDVVFQAEADEDIEDAPFKEFDWTNTLQGLYTSVWAGMVVYISSTTSFLKDYKYRGRVAVAPSATVFQIDLNATQLVTGDIITVIRDADLFARVREFDLLDGRTAYHNLPPMTTGLPSVIVLYDSDNDGSVAWTPAQTGIAVASGATIASYAWAISGTGASSVSNAAVQNPNFTFAAGFHYLVRLTTTDSNGVTNFIIVQVYAISRTFTAPVILPAAAGDVHQDLDNGYTGSITAYGGVENLPYRTHAAVFCVERFGDASSTPIVTNVLMHGRLRSESILTEGSDEGGALQQVTYPIEGITSYMQRLKMPNDIVRHVAAPDEWGEMVNPTPYRMAVYALFAYSTLLNLVSFSAGDALFAAWRRGGEALSVDGGYALDVLKTMMAFVDAAPNYAPDGEIRNEITASYKVDRSALVTVMDFLVQDARDFTLDIDTSSITAQVTGYGGVWNTVNNLVIYYTASAPTVPYSDAPETRELTRLLLKHDSTTAQAVAEIEARTGNDYAVNNPKWLLSVTLRDSHRWMVATNYQRYTWTLAALYDVREIALTTAMTFQLQSIDITINPDGTYDVSAQFVQETEFLNAQSIGGLLPINLEGMNPVLPVLSDDPAFPDDPLWSYPTDTPSQDELQPIDPYSAYLSYSPFTPDQAAQAAAQQPQPGCFVTQVNMRNSGTTLGDTTVNTDPYLQQVSGSGEISATGLTISDDMTAGLGANTHEFSATYPFAQQGDNTIGGAWQASGGRTGGGSIAGAVATSGITVAGAVIDLGSERTVVAASFWFKHLTAPGAFDQVISFWDDSKAHVETHVVSSANPPDWALAAWTGSTAGVRYIAFHSNLSAGGTNLIDDISVTYGSAGVVNADAFYFWDEGAEEAAQLFGATEGFLIDGAKPAVIPDYRSDHVYAGIPYTGTGNPLQLNYALADYTDVDNRLLTVVTCENP